MPPRTSLLPAYATPAYPAASLVVDSGANGGDILGAPEAAYAGDYYRLSRSAAPVSLSLSLPHGLPDGTAGEVARGSGLGFEGEALQFEGRLWLMAPDGDRVEVLVVWLESAGRLALPLTPLRSEALYVLIAADSAPGPLRIAEALAGAFATGTRILTADGRQLPVEALEPGMAIVTRDRGPQTLLWNGKAHLRAEAGHAPVVVSAGAMGNSGPLVISPNHRLFLYRREARALAGGAELLIQARHLVNGQDIQRREGGFVTYHSLVFAQHEVIYAEGLPCESLMVSPETLSHLPEKLALSLQEAFPGLSQHLHIGRELSPDDLAHLNHLAASQRG